MSLILFIFFNCLVSILFMLLSSNLIYCLLFLIFCFINLSVILVLIGVPYFSLIFITISVGAVGVFFLFVIMGYRLKHLVLSNYYYFIFFVILFLFSGLFILFFSFGFSFDVWFADYLPFSHWLNSSVVVDSFSFHNFYVLSYLIYTDFYIYLLVGAILLFIAMIGSITITNYKQSILGSQIPNQLFIAQNDSYSLIRKKTL